MQRDSVRGLVGDTSFWIAAFDPKDQFHKTAARFLEIIPSKVILMPWPIMYEVLRTRTVKNAQMVAGFNRIIRRPKVHKVDDASYRIECLENTLANASRRPISLVDMIVRAVLMDKKYTISQLLTFNPADFVDVCKDRNVRIWPELSR
jgi:predicted nucleic acid-binding protein